MLTLPSMMDSKDRNGNKIRGLFLINHLSCVGSFNGGEEAKRFEHFIRTFYEKNTQQAQTFVRVWAELKNEVGGKPDPGRGIASSGDSIGDMSAQPLGK